MTSDEIAAIVAKHEMQRIELKESFDVECIETACAFANAHGGLIFIGVTDRGELSKSQLRRESLRDYENRISTSTEPSVAVDAEKVEFRGREIVVLRVMENPLKPVACKGRCFVRKGSVNHQMTPAEIAECHLKSTGGSMDAVIMSGVTKDDLDMAAVRRYMDLSVENGRRSFSADDDPWETLLKLEWVKSEQEITRAVYLLFAKDTQRKGSTPILVEMAKWVGEFLTVYKARNATQTPSKSTQEPENTTLSSVNTTQRKRRLTAVQQSILEYLSKHPQATRKEVAGGLGSVTEDGVKYSLVRLQSLGLLKRVGPDFGGHWEIVEKSSPTGGKDIDS